MNETAPTNGHRRVFPEGTTTKPIRFRVTSGEFVQLHALAARTGRSIGDIMTSAALADQGALSRGEANRLMGELIATRDALGEYVRALRETGELTPEVRGELRELDTRLFNVTEGLR